MNIPQLIGKAGIAKLFEVKPTSTSHLVGAKGFPEPVTEIDGRSFWLESDVLAYKEAREAK